MAVAARPLDDRVDRIVRRCYAGLDVDQLRRDVLGRLRAIMPVDAVFFATVDPATMLFTSATAEEPLRGAGPLFLDNEFGRADVNKFTTLAAAADPVSSLDHATDGNRGASARYREVMAPLQLGDELRAALISAGRCWGVICLHREKSPFGFTDRELRLVRRLAPHLGEGLRRNVLDTRSQNIEPDEPGPGIIVLDAGQSIISISAEAEHWLAQISDTAWQHSTELPIAIYTAAARLGHPHRIAAQAVPTSRLRTRSGRWLTVHATLLSGPSHQHTAVILQPAAPAQLRSLLLDAHGLTPAQQRVTALVLQGRSTHQIVRELRISAYTVQEHLRAAFDKFGVGSRRELIATLLHQP